MAVKKVLMVFGTRPEAIKMVPVIHEFKKYQDQLELKICITAQHREMLDQVLRLFAIKADYDLNIMKAGQDLTDITASVLTGLRKILMQDSQNNQDNQDNQGKQDKFDLVMVHGDTTTTFAASLAAFYQKIPVAHVEAGLRTHLRYSPWPEEKNRHLTAALTSFHFAPTIAAKNNLLAEGICENDILVTGNTVVDALFLTLDRLKRDEALRKSIEAMFPPVKLGAGGRPVKRIVVTTHRRENFGDGMIQIFKSLQKIASRPDVEIIFPVHLNPNVKGPAEEYLSGLTNVHLMGPIDYAPFVYLMSTAYLILTDSGGVQEEAPSLGVPVLVMRDTSERMEAVERGVVRLVGPNADKIISSTVELLDDEVCYKKMSEAQNPYGDGHAASTILSYLVRKMS